MRPSRLVASSPIKTTPRWGASNPAISLNTVLLPEPDGPTSTVTAPSGTLRLSSLRTGSRP